jgi:hypothetical protein
MLRGIDGFAVARRLRARSRFSLLSHPEKLRFFSPFSDSRVSLPPRAAECVQQLSWKRQCISLTVWHFLGRIQFLS